MNKKLDLRSLLIAVNWCLAFKLKVEDVTREGHMVVSKP